MNKLYIGWLLLIFVLAQITAGVLGVPQDKLYDFNMTVFGFMFSIWLAIEMVKQAWGLPKTLCRHDWKEKRSTFMHSYNDKVSRTCTKCDKTQKYVTTGSWRDE